MRHHPTHLDSDSYNLYPTTTAMFCFPISIKKACGTSVAAEPRGTAGSILAQPASLLKTRSLGMSGIWTLCLPPRSDGVDYICLDSALLWNYLLPLLTACSYFSLVLAPRSLSITKQGSLYHPVTLLSNPSTHCGHAYTSYWQYLQNNTNCDMPDVTELSTSVLCYPRLSNLHPHPHDLITHTPFPFLSPPVFPAFLLKIPESHPRVT